MLDDQAETISITLASGRGASILRKEDKTMKYSKPDVTVLGNAKELIAAQSKAGSPSDGDINNPHNGPAYDLDE
jgi:hypothetical protein